MFQQQEQQQQEQPGQPGRQYEARAEFWEEFARHHGHDLRRCVAAAMRRLGWRGDSGTVEELMQEVYCRVLDGRSDGTAGGWSRQQLWAYLNRIARSVVIDEVRSRCARKRGGARNAVAIDTSEDGAGGGSLEPRAIGPTPEERLLARERAGAVRRRVCELGGADHGPRNLRILELAAVEGCTAVEISRRLAGALTASSIHTVLHRLRQQLLAAPGAELAAMLGG